MAQESMPVTPEEVCSRALVLCGMEPMTSFADTGRDEIVVASQLYEIMVMAALSSFPWSFATGQQQLELAATDPLDRYETAWHMPSLPMPLQLQRVTLDDAPLNYDIVGGLIYTNADPTSIAIATYQYRVQEAYWMPQFTMFLIYDIASAFASSVTRNAKQIQSFEQMSQLMFARAKTRDSQARSAKRALGSGLRRNLRRLPGFVAQ